MTRKNRLVLRLGVRPFCGHMLSVLAALALWCGAALTARAQTPNVDFAVMNRIVKGEISGSEALYVDGRIEGKITMPESRVTIGRNGKVDASIQAREVVVMGKVTGNIECSDRVDIRAEGSVHGDISTTRISVEDGASLKGGIQVRSDGKAQNQSQSKQEQPKAMAATASA